MRSDSDLHEPRTNAEQSETGGDVRVSYESRAPFPFEQTSKEEFARMRRLCPSSPDAKYTYFMRDRRSGLIKIGMSNNPDKRRAQLSGTGALDMEILLTLRDGNLEGCYHQYFAAHRVHGEWFERCPEIEAEIERLNEHPLSRSHP